MLFRSQAASAIVLKSIVIIFKATSYIPQALLCDFEFGVAASTVAE